VQKVQNVCKTVRNSYTDVFAKGSRTTVSADDANGTLVASRNYGDTTLYVGFNINENESRTVELKLAANTTYTDLYSNSQYQSDADGVVSKDKDFGQGFRSFVLEPRKKTIYGVKLATIMLLGEENAGKTAFIFQRNITTQQMEFLDSTIIDEAGHVAVPFVDFTDFVILYK